jgi:hypothetical protein
MKFSFEGLHPKRENEVVQIVRTFVPRIALLAVCVGAGTGAKYNEAVKQERCSPAADTGAGSHTRTRTHAHARIHTRTLSYAHTQVRACIDELSETESTASNRTVAFGRVCAVSSG